MRLGRALACALAVVVASLGAEAPVAAEKPRRPACGKAVHLKANGEPWRCTFASEFNGKRLDKRKWSGITTAKTGYHSGPDCYTRGRRNVSVSGGSLKLSVVKSKRPITCRSPLRPPYTTYYRGATISTLGKFSQARGRFEARVRFPKSKIMGLQSVFWLTPQDSYAFGPVEASGEIDVAELFTAYHDRLIPFVHYLPEKLHASQTNNYCLVPGLGKGWHRLTLLWDETAITIRYDGSTCLHHKIRSGFFTDAPQPFDRPFAINLTQGLGVPQNEFLPGVTELPATMQVDYVRVWR